MYYSFRLCFTPLLFTPWTVCIVYCCVSYRSSCSSNSNCDREGCTDKTSFLLLLCSVCVSNFSLKVSVCSRKQSKSASSPESMKSNGVGVGVWERLELNTWKSLQSHKSLCRDCSSCKKVQKKFNWVPEKWRDKEVCKTWSNTYNTFLEIDRKEWKGSESFRVPRKRFLHFKLLPKKKREKQVKWVKTADFYYSLFLIKSKGSESVTSKLQEAEQERKKSTPCVFPWTSRCSRERERKRERKW